MTDTDDLRAQVKYEELLPDRSNMTDDERLFDWAADRIDQQDEIIERLHERARARQAEVERLRAQVRAPGVAYPKGKGEPYYYDDPIFKGGSYD